MDEEVNIEKRYISSPANTVVAGPELVLVFTQRDGDVAPVAAPVHEASIGEDLKNPQELEGRDHPKGRHSDGMSHKSQ